MMREITLSFPMRKFDERVPEKETEIDRQTDRERQINGQR